MRCLGDIALLKDIKPGDVIHAPNNRIYYVLETIDSILPDIDRTLSILVISSNDEPRLFEQDISKFVYENYPFVWSGVYMALGK